MIGILSYNTLAYIGEAPILLTIVPATQSDRVFHLLEVEIVSGRLPMGSKLGEETLASRFGVSRGPLREALRRLEGRGLVARTAHSGVRVIELGARDMFELYQIREALEGSAARLAAEHMPQQKIEELAAFLNQQANSIEPGSDISYPQGIEDQDFHHRIAAGCGSVRLQRLLCEDLYSLIRLCRFRTWNIPGQRKAHRDHERIAEALLERDAELAEVLMRRHVAAARGRFMTSEEGRQLNKNFVTAC
jgi:DNA-binding GntR family transcriptional regulator